MEQIQESSAKTKSKACSVTPHKFNSKGYNNDFILASQEVLMKGGNKSPHGYAQLLAVEILQNLDRVRVKEARTFVTNFCRALRKGMEDQDLLCHYPKPTRELLVWKVQKDDIPQITDAANEITSVVGQATGQPGQKAEYLAYMVGKEFIGVASKTIFWDDAANFLEQLVHDLTCAMEARYWHEHCQKLLNFLFPPDSTRAQDLFSLGTEVGLIQKKSVEAIREFELSAMKPRPQLVLVSSDV